MRPTASRRLLGVVGTTALWVVSACAEVRQPDAVAACVNWRDDIGAVLSERCAECHAGAEAAAGYDLTSYLGALGAGSDDVDNALAGDAESRLLATLEPGSGDTTHSSLDDVYPLLRTWVVECDLSYFDSYVHTGGILNRHAHDFHASMLRESGWDFAACQTCHGEDFAGGAAEVSCTSCHTQGPKDCSTCHPVMDSGAHPTHLAGGALEKPLGCNACHLKPVSFEAPGHVFLADGSLDPLPVEVVFGPFADHTLDPEWRSGPASFSAESQSCGNVYCHGGALADAAASNPTPVWTAPGAGQAACGTCHGLPPTNHQSAECWMCHGEVVDASLAIIDTARHLDGVIDLFGDDAPTCTTCHGNAETGSPAPPRSVLGETEPSSMPVGAHQSHLASSTLRGPVACEECHAVPTEISSSGHLDTPLPAEVFPAGAASLAAADGAPASFDPASGSCGVYCHAAGDRLLLDQSPGILRAPVWTDTSGAAKACGACHGVPPDDGVHAPTYELTQCSVCHFETMDAFGELRLIENEGVIESTHINGVIDVR